MRRFVFCALVFFAALLVPLGGARGEITETGELVIARVDCGTDKTKCLKAGKKKKVSQVKQKNVPNPPVRVKGKRVSPQQNAPGLTPPSPKSGQPRLTAAQQEMLDRFNECLGYSSVENPVDAVKEFVFSEQQKLEDLPGWRAPLAAIYGSRSHHAYEVCFTRAYGLKGFRSLLEIKTETGQALLPIESPYVEIVEREIPPERRLARSWTRDYVVELADAMRQYFAEKYGTNVKIAPLEVNSMIRSFDDQAGLVRAGRSPADCRYRFLCSTHTTGSSLDIGFRQVSREQKAWLRKQLIEDQRTRKIYFIVEFDHYHVFVLPPEYIGEE